MYRLITILLISISFLMPVEAQTVPADLIEAMKTGKAGKVAQFFHQSLELTILEKDYMASKDQATRLMENFFKENPPRAFKISFEGTKEKSRYAIGDLSTSNGDFRVNMFFMNKEGQRLIYYMSIEKESDYELYPGP